MTPLENARWWMQRGFHPIPVPYLSKKPVLKEWPLLELGEVELSRYFNGQAQNLGVIVGDERRSTNVQPS